MLLLAMAGCGQLDPHADLDARPEFAPLALHSGNVTYLTGWRMESFAEEADESLSIEEVLQDALRDRGAPERRFRYRPGGSPGYGYGAGALWARVQIRNETQVSAWLAEAMPNMSRVEVWLFRSADLERDGIAAQPLYRGADGRTVAYSEAPVGHRNYVFPLHLAPGETLELFVRGSGGPRFLSLRLRTPANLASKDYREQFVFGLYFGFFFVVCGYNLFLFFATREISYFYYVLYAAGFGFNMFAAHGYAREWLYPEAPLWADRLILTPSGISLVGSLGFTRTFLQLRTLMPRLSQVLIALQIVSALFAVWTLFHVNWGVWLFLMFHFLLSFSLILYASWRTLLLGRREARYFVLGWTLFLGLLIFEMIMASGLHHFDWYNYYFLLQVSALEMGVLSYALADRFHVLKDEKLRAEGRLLQERTHIARELHDAVGSELTGLLARSRADGESKELRERLAFALQNLRDIVFLLNPQRDAAGSLESEMQKIAERMRAAGFAVDFRAERLGPELGMERSLQVLRIFQEWMTNTIRHSGAERLKIRWRRRGKRASLLVADDGRGFAWSGSSSGSGEGLANMRRRSRKLQASIQCRRLRRGSLFRLSAPLGEQS